MGECWQNGHATFLIMGDRCTRNCGFCSVQHAAPQPLDPSEAGQVSEMVALLKLKYAVITSVTRDDLPDKGSGHFADLVRQLKNSFPDLHVEVLIPDFDGNHDFLDKVLESSPDVLGHNVETIARLYPFVNRPPANYERSLSVLDHAVQRGAISKTGLMVGLGETDDELWALFDRLAHIGVSLLTIGQYLQPVSGKVAVQRYVHPDDFARLQEKAEAAGIRGVVAGPFVRSSYHAEALYQKAAAHSRRTTHAPEGIPCAT